MGGVGEAAPAMVRHDLDIVVGGTAQGCTFELVLRGPTDVSRRRSVPAEKRTSLSGLLARAGR